MPLTIPYPMQKSDITFGYDSLYESFRALGIGRSGVMANPDMVVAQRAAGANMSVDVASGYAWIIPVSSVYAGPRLIRNLAVSNSGTPGNPGSDWLSTFSAADATNPRIDRVCLTARDHVVDSSGAYDAKFRVVTGTPTPGATLVNLNGAGAMPANSLLLANVLVPAGATSITAANIDTQGDGWNGGVNIRPCVRPESSYLQLDRVASQSITNNTATDISFDTEYADTDGMFYLTDPTKIYGRSPGYYLVSVRVQFAANATGYRGLSLLAESNFVFSASQGPAAPAGIPTELNCSAVFSLGGGSNGRYVRAQVIQNSGAALNVTRAILSANCVNPYSI